ncbi:MAG: hypothetical protein RLY43_920 [Bacteroidota bacterium]|jgi:hypothetical protein|nr:DUF1573 domain-containing protein [uncultured Flavobacterium sp.]
MKKVIVTFVLFSIIFSCKKSNSLEDLEGKYIEEQLTKHPKTEIEFDKTEHDFGTINQGEIVETQFMLKNIGANDLYVAQARASCGCTVPEVTKEAIKPGKSTPIKVKFDSNGKQGNVEKTITITCNSEDLVEQVKIKATIKTK